MNKIAKFTIVDSYDDAIKQTEDSLMPIAAKLFTVQNHIPNNDFELADNFNPVTLGVASTTFLDKEANGKWGWTSLEMDTRNAIANLLLDNNLFDQWVFIAQELADE